MPNVIIRRTAPVGLAAIVAIIMNIEYFFSTPQGSSLASTLRTWAILAAGFTYVLAGILVSIRHIRPIQKKVSGQWLYSSILLFCMWAMVVFGLFSGPGNPSFVWAFQNIVVAVYSAMLATCAFFVTSAAYRAFRARTLEATLMLIFTALVMLGQATLGELIWPGFVPLSLWIINVPMNAGLRGLTITIAFGFIALCLRIISGLETRWLGD